MPAPEVDSYTKGLYPAVGHVSLMVDTLIANASIDDLRAIIRSHLTTSSPDVSASFVDAARGCLRQTLNRGQSKPPTLFETREERGRCYVAATPKLNSLLAYTRSLYGAGMGFDSIDVLTGIVRATTGLRWDATGSLTDVFAVIDTDISQAIQSCKEEVVGGHLRDASAARAALRKLRLALAECREEVNGWGVDFPFSRGSSNADCFQF